MSLFDIFQMTLLKILNLSRDLLSKKSTQWYRLYPTDRYSITWKIQQLMKLVLLVQKPGLQVYLYWHKMSSTFLFSEWLALLVKKPGFSTCIWIKCHRPYYFQSEFTVSVRVDDVLASLLWTTDIKFILPPQNEVSLSKGSLCPGGSLCTGSHSRGSLCRDVSVQGFSVQWGFCAGGLYRGRGVSVRETNLSVRSRSTHPTGMLSCIPSWF